MRASSPPSRYNTTLFDARALCLALLVCLVGCSSKMPSTGAYGGRRSHERSFEQEQMPRGSAADSLGQLAAAAESDIVAMPPVQPAQGAQRAQIDAIEACESAEVFLDEGELDDAIAALDRAYELMLDLPENGDPVAAQTKADIRRIVAEKLVDIYASQRTAAGEPRIEWDLEIRIVENDRVQREIESFQKAEGGFLIEAYRRSGRYRPMILAKLAEAGLPSQLSWLPLIESGFEVNAYSRAKALGMWQFILSTGRRYGLSRDSWIDERMDPERSTDAAIAYLSELHDLFGDWPQALAAYNCGENRVLRLDRQEPGQDLDFWDLYEQLPRETRAAGASGPAARSDCDHDGEAVRAEGDRDTAGPAGWIAAKLQSRVAQGDHTEGRLRAEGPGRATCGRARVPARDAGLQPSDSEVRHAQGQKRAESLHDRQYLRRWSQRDRARQRHQERQSHLSRPTHQDTLGGRSLTVILEPGGDGRSRHSCGSQRRHPLGHSQEVRDRRQHNQA